MDACQGGYKRACVLSGWQETGTCSQTCGGGVVKKVRTVLKAAEHGGLECHPEQEKWEECNAEPCPIEYPGTLRSEAQVAASVEIHKRVNPGYVEMPYTASSQTDFVYKPPPDFTKAFLKKDSDCGFQKFAAEAILKHVDLKKTSH